MIPLPEQALTKRLLYWCATAASVPCAKYPQWSRETRTAVAGADAQNTAAVYNWHSVSLDICGRVVPVRTSRVANMAIGVRQLLLPVADHINFRRTFRGIAIHLLLGVYSFWNHPTSTTEFGAKIDRSK